MGFPDVSADKESATRDKMWVRSLGWEDPLEKEMAIHSSTIAWKIAWTEEPVGYSPWGCKESDMTDGLHFHFHVYTKINMESPLVFLSMENPILI